MRSIGSYPVVRVALITVLTGILTVSSAFAAAAPAKHASAKSKAAASADDVETRITTLHNQLRITPEQEPAWNNVAQVMRDNDKRLKDLREDKAENLATANAVEQVTSYAKIVDAHAEGVRGFVPAFQSLYDTLSADQKKKADEVFRQRAREGARRPTP